MDAAVLKAKRPFRFFKFLMQNPEFIHVIREHWYSFYVVGSAIFRVSKKLKQLKSHIKSFSRDTYSGEKGC